MQADGGVPSRDELTLAWSDAILPTLSPRAKAFFSAGRFVEGDDRTAVFALPNAPHVEKCEKHRPDVEAALAAHFGRPVPLRLVVDTEGAGDGGPVGDPPAADADGPATRATPAARAAAPRPADPPPDRPDHDIDLSELTDATGTASSSVDRVRELFPGAELVDEG